MLNSKSGSQPQPTSKRAADGPTDNAIVTQSPLPGDDSPEVDRARELWQLALWIAIRQTHPRELSQGAKLCWDVIARFERRGFECWAGLIRMGHEIGVSESQASRYFAELIEKHYVERAMGTKGKPIYRRLPQPDLEVRASKVYQELSAKTRNATND